MLKSRCICNSGSLQDKDRSVNSAAVMLHGINMQSKKDAEFGSKYLPHFSWWLEELLWPDGLPAGLVSLALDLLFIRSVGICLRMSYTGVCVLASHRIMEADQGQVTFLGGSRRIPQNGCRV